MNTSVKSVVKALDEKNLKPDPVANLVNTSFKAGITLGRIFDVRYLTTFHYIVLYCKFIRLSTFNIIIN
jgi:hypothetical protein